MVRHNIVFALLCLFLVVNCKSVDEGRQKRFFPALEWLFGSRCGICPPRFCDDDPDIILGYCCGCRPQHLQDFLPIVCTPNLRCPTNGYRLCENFERMMSCCCS